MHSNSYSGSKMFKNNIRVEYAYFILLIKVFEFFFPGRESFYMKPIFMKVKYIENNFNGILLSFTKFCQAIIDLLLSDWSYLIL